MPRKTELDVMGAAMMRAQFTNWAVLDAIYNFCSTIAYVPEDVLRAFTCELAVTHGTRLFTTVGHWLTTSKDWGSGKSTLTCDLPLLLANNPWQITRTTTQDAIRSKYTEPEDFITLVCDDVGKIFGDDGTKGKQTVTYDILIKSYRRKGTFSVSRNGVARDLPCFGVAFMNGLNSAVPSDLRDRSIETGMKKAPRGWQGRDALDPDIELEAEDLREGLHAWVGNNADQISYIFKNKLRGIHPALNLRLRQKWGPLFAIAGAAGGPWPGYLRQAFVNLALDASERPKLTPDQQIIMDTAEIARRTGLDRIFTSDLMAMLRQLPDRPLYTETSDDYFVKKLAAALGPAHQMRAVMQTGPYAGESGNAKGRETGLIVMQAGKIAKALYEPEEEAGPDETERELEFVPDEVEV